MKTEISKSIRLLIYWALFATMIFAPASFFLLIALGTNLGGFDVFCLFRLAGGSMALLLIWSAIYIRVERPLARFAIVTVAILLLLTFAGLRMPEF
jgi:hypothetical protein